MLAPSQSRHQSLLVLRGRSPGELVIRLERKTREPGEERGRGAPARDNGPYSKNALFCEAWCGWFFDCVPCCWSCLVVVRGRQGDFICGGVRRSRTPTAWTSQRRTQRGASRLHRSDQIRTKTIQNFEKFFLNILKGPVEVDDAEEALVEYNGSPQEVKGPEIQ